MKKRFPIFAVLLLAAMCVLPMNVPAEQAPVPRVFAVVPENFAPSDILQRPFSVLDGTGAVIGGLIATDLKPEDLQDTDSDGLLWYLYAIDGSSEYFAWFGSGAGSSILYLTQQITVDDVPVQKYYRVFFAREDTVFDLWFDLEATSKEDISALVDMVEKEAAPRS